MELEIPILYLFEFPAKIVERHYSSIMSAVLFSCRSCVYIFEFPAQIIRHYSSKFVNVSCQSSVAQLSVKRLYLNFPLRLLSVIIPQSLLMSAVGQASLSCRSSVAHPSSVAESLPRTAFHFLFSFFSSFIIMSENHLDACRLVDAYFRLNLEW